MIEPKDRIIVAVDTSDLKQAIRWVMALRGHVGHFKLGSEFTWHQGWQGILRVQEACNTPVFVDSKLSDIPNTVFGTASGICQLRPWMLNVHAMAGPESVRAACNAAKAVAAETMSGPRALVTAVTVLTSLDPPALQAIGITAATVVEAVVKLALLAQECDCDGVIASPLEIEAVRQACGPDFLIVTPGIRPAGADANDQARLATPRVAIEAGADHLVIGRPITAAPDPVAAAVAIADEIALATAPCPHRD